MTPRVKAALAAQAEFRRHRASLAKLGISECQYIATRLKDQGFSRAEIEETRISDRRPLHIKLPGLCVESPTGNEVGA